MIDRDIFNLLLPYMLSFKKMRESAEDYAVLPIINNQIKYLNMHDKFKVESDKLFDIFEPLDVIEILGELKQLCNLMAEDIINEFEPQVF